MHAKNTNSQGGVHLIHIKGHSDQLGNEKADERVQWGKENGPYCLGGFYGNGVNARLPKYVKRHVKRT